MLWTSLASRHWDFPNCSPDGLDLLNRSSFYTTCLRVGLFTGIHFGFKRQNWHACNWFFVTTHPSDFIPMIYFKSPILLSFHLEKRLGKCTERTRTGPPCCEDIELPTPITLDDSLCEKLERYYKEFWFSQWLLLNKILRNMIDDHWISLIGEKAVKLTTE